MSEKVGIGIITYNRVQFFRECIQSLPEVDVIVVVNDGDPYPYNIYPSRVAKIIQNTTNKGVGRSKNAALKFLLETGCKHIFLCEDDMKIIDSELCKRYIQAAK